MSKFIQVTIQDIPKLDAIVKEVRRLQSYYRVHNVQQPTWEMIEFMFNTTNELDRRLYKQIWEGLLD